jgi:S1-C subfamily serine protease
VLLAAFVLLVHTQGSVPQSEAPRLEINTALMLSTFHLQAPSTTTGEIATGTGLVVGRTCKADPTMGATTLVTAAHVFEKMAGDNLIVQVHVKKPDGSWQRVPHLVRIRENGRPLWVQHPDADVAAIYVSLPEGALPQFLPVELFATDKTLTELEIHPGDAVLAVGFPHGVEANTYGFPILRSGRIASFPLFPQADVKTFLVDMEVFPGNSGGPVYLWDRNRLYGGGVHVGEVSLLMGIVTDTIFAKQPPDTRLVLARVLHAKFVLDVVAMLPERPCGK